MSGEYRVMFTVYREFYVDIVSGKKVLEFRKPTKRWLTVANAVSSNKWWGIGTIATFVCGRDIHRRKIIGVEMIKGMLQFEIGEVV